VEGREVARLAAPRRRLEAAPATASPALSVPAVRAGAWGRAHAGRREGSCSPHPLGRKEAAEPRGRARWVQRRTALVRAGPAAHASLTRPRAAPHAQLGGRGGTARGPVEEGAELGERARVLARGKRAGECSLRNACEVRLQCRAIAPQAARGELRECAQQSHAVHALCHPSAPIHTSHASALPVKPCGAAKARRGNTRTCHAR